MWKLRVSRTISPPLPLYEPFQEQLVIAPSPYANSSHQARVVISLPDTATQLNFSTTSCHGTSCTIMTRELKFHFFQNFWTALLQLNCLLDYNCCFALITCVPNFTAYNDLTLSTRHQVSQFCWPMHWQVTSSAIGQVHPTTPVKPPLYSIQCAPFHLVLFRQIIH